MLLLLLLLLLQQRELPMALTVVRCVVCAVAVLVVELIGGGMVAVCPPGAGRVGGVLGPTPTRLLHGPPIATQPPAASLGGPNVHGEG
jgi:hypothetical protein